RLQPVARVGLARRLDTATPALRRLGSVEDARQRLPGTSSSLYAPETKSLTEVAGLSGCAGVKFRRQEALCVERRGLGDEGRGAVCKGALRGPDRGDQQARGGASFWHRPSDGGEDAVILGAAGIPAQPAAGA